MNRDCFLVFGYFYSLYNDAAGHNLLVRGIASQFTTQNRGTAVHSYNWVTKRMSAAYAHATVVTSRQLLSLAIEVAAHGQDNYIM